MKKYFVKIKQLKYSKLSNQYMKEYGLKALGTSIIYSPINSSLLSHRSIKQYILEWYISAVTECS